MVDQKMHDCFRDLVGNHFAHDVEVGGYETADELGFEGFTFGEIGSLGDSCAGL